MMNKKLFAKYLPILTLFILAGYLATNYAYAVKKPVPRATLKLTRLDFSNGYWNYQTDWILQNLNSGSIKVNGHIFVDGITQSGTDYTGYSLKPKKSYSFIYYSKNGGRGSILARKTVVPPKSTTVTINPNPSPTPTPTPTHIIIPTPTPTQNPASISTKLSSPDVYVLEDDGTVIDSGFIQSDQGLIDLGNTLKRESAMKKFFKDIPSTVNQYDFAMIFETFSPNQHLNTAEPALYTPVKDFVRGTSSLANDRSISIRNQLGLSGNEKFQGYADMNNLDNFNDNWFFMIHEIGHRWLFYIQGKTIQTPVYRSHYNENINTLTKEGELTYKDPMGGGSLTVNSALPGYCLDFGSGGKYRFAGLSLYLMGLISADKVTPLEEYETSGSWSENGISCTKKPFSVQDVINIVGPRFPVYPDTQKDFSVVYILVTKKGEKPTDTQLQKMNYIRDNFPAEWNKATNYKSTINSKGSIIN